MYIARYLVTFQLTVRQSSMLALRTLQKLCIVRDFRIGFQLVHRALRVYGTWRLQDHLPAPLHGAIRVKFYGSKVGCTLVYSAPIP